jgi:thermitase
MNRCNWKVLLLGLFVAVSCTRSKSGNPEVGNSFKEGEILVTTSNVEGILATDPTLKVVEVYPEINIYKVFGKTLSGREHEIAKQWVKSSLATVAEPNFIVTLANISPEDEAIREKFKTTDPHYLDMWGLNNVGQDAPGGSEGATGADIFVQKAWQTTTGSHDVLVAVMDTGIDLKHEDLCTDYKKKDSCNIYVNQAEFDGEVGKDDDGNGYVDDKFGWNFVSSFQTELNYGQLGAPLLPDDLEKNVLSDGHGHGTHVAGTIGALVNNGKGIAGVNHKVKMIALKVLSDEGSGETADIIRAIRYATKMGVDIVNASFGGGGRSAQFYAALKAAGEAGVLFVAAAGNSTQDNDERESFPSSYDLDSILAVAATDNRDNLASFSSYGYHAVDIAAPGVNVLSTFPMELAKREGTPDYPYRSWSGTSMATPHVAGAAALLLAARPDLKKKPGEIKKILMESADWKPQLAGRVRSGGRLNIARAIVGDLVPFLEENNWQEKELNISSASLPSEHVDQLIPVKVDGAKAIQVHISSILMDSIDLAALYDGALRLISFLPSDKVDYWTPVVYGNTINLRFANSLVSVQKVKEKKVVDNPTEVSDDAMCFPLANGKFECTVWHDPTDPFGNNRSEGFVVNKVKYLQ